jgi:SAM-dependent methyltransferase
LCAPEEWTNFDASPTLRVQRLPGGKALSRLLGPTFPPNVRYGDIVKGLPVPAGSCAAVYCSHTLEHLALDDFARALANTFACLKPGGTFRLVLPDLEAMARAYVESTDPEASVRFLKETLLGVPTRERGAKGMLRPVIGNSAHLWMWDFKSMSEYLRRAGFSDVRRAQFGDSPDPMFKAVEDRARWDGQLGVECRRPG